MLASAHTCAFAELHAIMQTAACGHLLWWSLLTKSGCDDSSHQLQTQSLHSSEENSSVHLGSNSNICAPWQNMFALIPEHIAAHTHQAP